MNSFQKQRRNLTGNNWTLLQFELVFKLLTVVVAVPLFTGYEKLILWASGYSYLTAENLLRFFRNPVFLLSVILFMLVILLYFLLDLSAVIFNLHKSYHGLKTDPLQTLFFSLHTISVILRTKNKRYLLLVLLLMGPVFCLAILPVVTGNILVQDMILRQIRRRWQLALAAIAVVVLLIVCFLHWMYVCQIQILEQCSTSEAIKRSSSLGKNAHAKDLLFFGLSQLFCYAVYAVFLGLAMLLAMILEKTLHPGMINSVSTSLMLTVTTIALIFVAVWSSPVGGLCIGTLYYNHKINLGEEVPGPEVVDYSLPETVRQITTRNPVGTYVLGWLVIAASLAACSVYIFFIYRGRLNPSIEYIHQTEITAHRGASRYYPENTMAAFAGAVEQGADWLELDIHQSSDGKLFVMHDSSLYRTTGVHGNAWDYTWEELSGLDAGSSFSSRFKGERIPLLSEVIDFAIENGIRLNIEIKPSRYEEGLEENLVELLHEKDFVSECVVTSQKYRSVKLVKEFDEEITTVYVMGYAYGSIDNLSAADNFSVNMSSITRRLVSRVHNAGSQIYAWTVNRRTNIESMLEKNVDNIITDDVLLAKRILGETRTSNALHEYIRWLDQLF